MIRRGFVPRCILCVLVASSSPGADPPKLPAVKDLPDRPAMPDPLIARDGGKVATPEQWMLRREEMKQILEEYEYGHMPPPTGNVKGAEVRASTVLDGKVAYRLVHLTFGPEEKLGFDLGIFSPAETDKVKPPFATIVTLSFSAGENGADRYRAAFDRGYAVVAIPYQQLGADNPDYRKSAFFPAYPDYDWNDISAWAWGLSRAVDFLQTDPKTDKAKIIAMGVSRLGQAVLLAGAFDERISMVAPVCAGNAFRFSGKGRGGKQGIDEVVAQNTYWFGPKFAEFRGQTDKLPCDQHWLPALTAPRPYIVCNPLDDQYGNGNAAVQSYLGGKKVYEFLGVADRIGLHFRDGRHGMNDEDWAAILDFADKHLRGMDVKGKFDEIPPADKLH